MSVPRREGRKRGHPGNDPASTLPLVPDLRFLLSERILINFPDFRNYCPNVMFSDTPEGQRALVTSRRSVLWVGDTSATMTKAPTCAESRTWRCRWSTRWRLCCDAFVL